MKPMLLPVLAVLLAAAACSSDKSPLHLTGVTEVAGRQGVATDGTCYYVSGSTALYKYSLDGELLLANEQPFVAMTGDVNHIGDIDVHDGEIYAGCEYFMDGVGENIQVAVFDAGTLEYRRSIPWNPDSGQVECCGLAVDAARGHVWMADWVHGEFLYCYDLATSAYVGKVMLHPVPQLQQGICALMGKMLISCDDGDAEKEEPDHLYICDLYKPDGTLMRDAEVRLFRTMDDFRRTGEIEGLTFNPVTGAITVLANRGARIILGMPKGFYEGYDREIHELYTYQK